MPSKIIKMSGCVDSIVVGHHICMLRNLGLIPREDGEGHFWKELRKFPSREFKLTSREIKSTCFHSSANKTKFNVQLYGRWGDLKEIKTWKHVNIFIALCSVGRKKGKILL